MTTTRCGDKPESYLLKNDSGRHIGMITKTDDDRWTAYIGTQSEARPIGIASDLSIALGAIRMVDEAKQLLDQALARGKLGRAID